MDLGPGDGREFDVEVTPLFDQAGAALRSGDLNELKAFLNSILTSLRAGISLLIAT